MDKKHSGSNFDEFLAEEGLLEQAEAVVIKRVLAYRVEELMKEQNLSKIEMSRRMKTSRASLERLLDPGNQSVTLQTLGRAASNYARKGRDAGVLRRWNGDWGRRCKPLSHRPPYATSFF